jgi:putative ABC transport system ATP-binding protein
MMGPSGSGKSTLLAIISGLLRPDSGEVIALGQQLWQMSEGEQRRFRLRHCGFIFQGFNLFPSLTPREQLEMVLRWSEGASQREAERRVEEALMRLGLGHRCDLTADQLSGGEKQRVAIARALLKEPTFCFADEPTSSLDWKNGEQVIHLLRTAAHERGATIFIVAHDARIVPYAARIISHIFRAFHEAYFYSSSCLVAVAAGPVGRQHAGGRTAFQLFLARRSLCCRRTPSGKNNHLR